MANKKKGQKVLLTGGAGFIGSNVADHYLKQGLEAVIVDNLSTGFERNIPPQAAFYKADICDFKTLREIFKKEAPDFVNHHAAQIDVRTSLANPQKDAEINILGMINLLECAREFKAAKFIYGSTGGALYGEAKETAPTEDAAAHPLSHYGVSKYCGEHYLRLYAHLYGIPFTILRYGNVYGPRQNPKGEAGVTAIFIRAMLENRPIVIYGDGEQTRDYCFVEDVAAANFSALEKGTGRIINIGVGNSTSVNELFRLLKELTDYKQEARYQPKRSGELERSRLNVGLSKAILGWQAATSLKEGLKKTLRWQTEEAKVLDND